MQPAIHGLAPSSARVELTIVQEDRTMVWKNIVLHAAMVDYQKDDGTRKNRSVRAHTTVHLQPTFARCFQVGCCWEHNNGFNRRK